MYISSFLLYFLTFSLSLSLNFSLPFSFLQSVVWFFIFFSLKKLIYFNWRLITLQYCGGFYHTLTWISHGCTCVPHPEPPSHLLPHPIPQGHPSAPALSALFHALNLDWWSISQLMWYAHTFRTSGYWKVAKFYILDNWNVTLLSDSYWPAGSQMS